MWLAGVFKHYWLESGGWRWLHQSSQMSQDKIFSISSAEGQVSLALWQAEAAGLGMADEVTTSTAGPALLWIQLFITNPLLGLHDLQQACKPSPSSTCLNHHSSTALENADDRQATVTHQLPQATPTTFSFTLATGKYRERRKGVKIWANPPHIFSICNVPM